MDIDYSREYLPFLPHTPTLIAMYSCVAVVVALFVWGFVRRYRRYRGGGPGLWAAANGTVLPWGPRLSQMVRDVVLQAKVAERGLPAALHLPICWWLAKPHLADDANGSAPFCSEAVARAMRSGGLDTVPFLADRQTEPSDLARSVGLNYRFTLSD